MARKRPSKPSGAPASGGAAARTALLSAAVLFLFFLSGSLGLIYEVVWLRMLILIFGSTHFAVSTVLTAFMAGLAIGAWVIGREIDRRWDPLVVYGVFEIGIGAYALGIPWLFGFLEPVSRWLWAEFSPSFYWFSLLRFFFVGAVLVVPASLMGGTLPALSRFVTRRQERMGLSVGSLYGVNTFGAVAGTAATGFVLVPALGVQKTIWAAAAMNVAVGVLALALAARTRRAANAAGAARESEPAAGRATSIPPRVTLVLAVFAASGFIAMVYEIAWTRVLSLIIGSSVYAFTIMLTTFLVGLAVGASLMSRFADRTGSRLGADGIAILLASAGLSAFATLFLFHELPYAFASAFRSIHEDRGDSPAGHLMLFALQFVLSGAVMLPPTLFLGGIFPLAVRICGDHLRQVGRTVGTAYASNTLGTIFGSALGGFLVVPLFGIQGSILFAITVNMLLGAVLVVLACERRTRARVLAGVLLVVAAAGCWPAQPKWNTLLMNSGLYKYAADMTDEDLTESGFYSFTEGDFDLVFYREGVTATVMVAAQKGSGDLWLSVNGKIDASSVGDLQTQLLSGHVPLILSEERDDVAVIGYASGITVGSATLHPVRSVTAVEIEPAVIDASREFTAHNHDPLGNPDVQIVEGDGRNFLLVEERTFDVIISEPSNPWMTVASNLFTREFFEIGRSRLNPGGVFCQWLQLYGMQLEDLRALARTFAEVFPHVVVFNTIRDSDLLLLGANRPIRFRIDLIEDRMSDLDVALDLGRIGVRSPWDFLSYFIMSTEQFRAFAGEGPLNTDDNALIEFHAPRSMHAETRRTNLKALREHVADPLHYLEPRPGDPSSLADANQKMAVAYFRRGMHQEARESVERALAIQETEERHAHHRRLLERAGARDRGASS